MRVLVEHFENSERHLIESAKIAGITGHSLHKGTPREAFIRDFLGGHLEMGLGVGTGEIIDSDSLAGAARHQHDIVLYDTAFPKVYIGGGISVFLAESVVATIEVKSNLEEDDIEQAVGAALKTKANKQSESAPTRRPIASYVVAYDGPAEMTTVFRWVAREYHRLGKTDPSLDTGRGRAFTKSTALDAVFVLGRGACVFENNVGLAGRYAHKYPFATWSVMDSKSGSLLLLFASILGLRQTGGKEDYRMNPFSYINGFEPSKLQLSAIAGTKTAIVEVDPHNPIPSANMKIPTLLFPKGISIKRSKRSRKRQRMAAQKN